MLCEILHRPTNRHLTGQMQATGNSVVCKVAFDLNSPREPGSDLSCTSIILIKAMKLCTEEKNQALYL